MSSLLESLGIGNRGLSVSQTALSVAGQNITNADTEGYSRKKLKVSADWKPDGEYGQMGFGVEAEKVARLRDTLLDHTIIANQSDMGMQEQLNTAMTRMEALLSEPKDQGLGESMTAFWNAWQDLANNPSDIAARQAVIDTSQATIAKFHTLADGLQDLRCEQDRVLASKLKDINDLTERISSDNLAISAAESMPNGSAGDSRDDRGLALEKLSKLINIDYLEDAQGRVTVTCNGQMLVSPSMSIPLTAETNPASRPDGTTFTLTTLRVSNTRQQFIPRNGEIAGLLQARDQVIPKSQTTLDSIATTLVQSVNSLHRQGYDSVGTNGTNFFDPTMTSASTLSLLSEIATNPMALAAGAGGASQAVNGVSGSIPPGGTSFNLAKSVNPLYRDLLTGSVVVKTVGPPEVTLVEGATNDYVVDPGSGEIKFLNYTSFPEGTGVTVDFRYNTSGTRGAGDGRNALSIAQLKNKLLAGPDDLGRPTSTLVDAYSDFVGTIGANHSTIMSKVDTLTSLSTFYQNQAQTVSGVNLDEEMTDLVKFQHSYQASAKFISTVDKLLESVINL